MRRTQVSEEATTANTSGRMSHEETVAEAPEFRGYKDPNRFLAPSWAKQLSGEFESSYMLELGAFLQQEYAAHKILPHKSQIFRALKALDFDDVKVVILGQDPYPGLAHANGLAFAVENHVLPKPPSLQNIFKEIETEFGKKPQSDSTLLGWAEQGVLLLNSVLTVRAGESFSHRNKGWEQFTHKIVFELGKRKQPLVFLLWGAAAAAKKKDIMNSAHLVLTCAHPSPLSAHRGFLGCGHFKKTNTFLEENGLLPIDWTRTAASDQLAPSPC